ncbi:chromodomain-helicase-DNA-binding protein 4 [Pocillopora verrucosa]|uniref:40S ribosomal protein S19-binding protein 1 n=1 Tax=Pocillopora damicornis TaxID=46731 RepID=A0A3M6TRR1_POCDA|nr:uncharacterized protein LOC113674202 [Pocillopora damicornis]XP_058970606.1 uncharacterized protein LOC131797004 [Pocillopora verrucosa]RMX43958.1 hypothetical protein pdam_00019817 [Pocillopora damicornis]
MSSKLVRKGLDLVIGEGVSRSQKQKLKQKQKQLAKKQKRTSRGNKQKQSRAREVRGLQLSSGQKRKTQEVDFTEENLEYFKNATWKIKKDTYDKILERQSKFQRKKTKDEKVDDSDAEEPGGLFDD